MITTKIKKGDSFLLQVRCKNKEIANKALGQFSNFIKKIDGVHGEVILFFNI